MGAAQESGRLGWLVASTIVTAAVQRAVGSDGQALFLLTGGTLLQHRLGTAARATRDVGGLVRGDIEVFLARLDQVLKVLWGPLTLRRGDIEVINTPAKTVKPRRFSVTLSLRGAVWRKVQVESSPDEGDAGAAQDQVDAPPLAALGLPDAERLAGLKDRYQIAQKVHAATDPHEPPAQINDRARDVVDLCLLGDLAQRSGRPTNAEIAAAICDIFSFRAREAEALGRSARRWPAQLIPYPHWADDYAAGAASARLCLALHEAVAEVNRWLDEIDAVRAGSAAPGAGAQ
ncbi:MAG: nucleotidyl transferase AbiEii/AbiGii toxin family protein [Bifidobacteriaceae bacterium]|nr:nucleotidyl transferase AbiEii/AbiGii toxin family protein [Bifidobacteriaceae bacterium]